MKTTLGCNKQWWTICARHWLPNVYEMPISFTLRLAASPSAARPRPIFLNLLSLGGDVAAVGGSCCIKVEMERRCVEHGDMGDRCRSSGPRDAAPAPSVCTRYTILVLVFTRNAS